MIREILLSAFNDELEKTAASALRKRIKVVLNKDTREYLILLGGKEIGGVPVGPVRTASGQLTGIEAISRINKKYRGLNIYPKVLGEILKKEKALASGGSLSGSAYTQWSRFSKNNPGVVSPGMGEISLVRRLDNNRIYRASRPSTGEPVFTAKKPPGWRR